MLLNFSALFQHPASGEGLAPTSFMRSTAPLVSSLASPLLAFGATLVFGAACLRKDNTASVAVKNSV